ncbi:hypothetical protein QYF36_014292 [Acer negundo]|nr:hypothetical protein QYF36_014292 [Acer negundo]
MGHSKNGYTLDMGEQSGTAQADVQKEKVQNDVEKDTFRPWLQVSYGRTNRNNVGSFYAGKKSGTVANLGKTGNGSRNINGLSGHVADKYGKNREGRKKLAKEVVGSDARKTVLTNKGVKNGAKKVGGSRFSILSEGLEEEIGMGISDVENNCFNKPFKDNVVERRFVGKGRTSNKGNVRVLDSRSNDMEEVLEDSDVLQSLHKEVMGVVGSEVQFFFGQWLEKGMLSNLNSEVSKEEVRSALFGIGGLKTPSSDGFPTIFFQNQWSVCRKDVVILIVDSFKSGTFPTNINQTLIALIPKVPSPLNMSQIRPINLCNSTYKIISKVIVQKLRNLLPELVSPNQVAFVTGRQIQDNIVVA